MKIPPYKDVALIENITVHVEIRVGSDKEPRCSDPWAFTYIRKKVDRCENCIQIKSYLQKICNGEATDEPTFKLSSVKPEVISPKRHTLLHTTIKNISKASSVMSSAASTQSCLQSLLNAPRKSMVLPMTSSSISSYEKRLSVVTPLNKNKSPSSVCVVHKLDDTSAMYPTVAPLTPSMSLKSPIARPTTCMTDIPKVHPSSSTFAQVPVTTKPIQFPVKNIPLMNSATAGLCTHSLAQTSNGSFTTVKKELHPIAIEIGGSHNILTQRNFHVSNVVTPTMTQHDNVSVVGTPSMGIVQPLKISANNSVCPSPELSSPVTKQQAVTSSILQTLSALAGPSQSTASFQNQITILNNALQNLQKQLDGNQQLVQQSNQKKRKMQPDEILLQQPLLQQQQSQQPLLQQPLLQQQQQQQQQQHLQQQHLQQQQHLPQQQIVQQQNQLGQQHQLAQQQTQQHLHQQQVEQLEEQQKQIEQQQKQLEQQQQLKQQQLEQQQKQLEQQQQLQLQQLQQQQQIQQLQIQKQLQLQQPNQHSPTHLQSEHVQGSSQATSANLTVISYQDIAKSAAYSIPNQSILSGQILLPSQVSSVEPTSIAVASIPPTPIVSTPISSSLEQYFPNGIQSIPNVIQSIDTATLIVSQPVISSQQQAVQPIQQLLQQPVSLQQPQQHDATILQRAVAVSGTAAVVPQPQTQSPQQIHSTMQPHLQQSIHQQQQSLPPSSISSIYALQQLNQTQQQPQQQTAFQAQAQTFQLLQQQQHQQQQTSSLPTHSFNSSSIATVASTSLTVPQPNSIQQETSLQQLTEIHTPTQQESVSMEVYQHSTETSPVHYQAQQQQQQQQQQLLVSPSYDQLPASQENTKVAGLTKEWSHPTINDAIETNKIGFQDTPVEIAANSSTETSPMDMNIAETNNFLTTLQQLNSTVPTSTTQFAEASGILVSGGNVPVELQEQIQQIETVLTNNQMSNP